MCPAKRNIIKTKKIVGSPLQQVKKMISRDKFRERAFIKAPRGKVEDVTARSELGLCEYSRRLISNYKKSNDSSHYFKIHTHALVCVAIVTMPSFVDILNLRDRSTHVIYVKNNKNILGSIVYYATKPKLIDRLVSKIDRTFDNCEKVVHNTKLFDWMICDLHNLRDFKVDLYEAVLYKELLVNPKTNKTISKVIMKPISRKVLSKLGHLLELNLESSFRKLHLIDKKMHYFGKDLPKIISFIFLSAFSKKFQLDVYKLLGVKFRFVPNKKAGYKFNSNTISFVKDKTIKA